MIVISDIRFSKGSAIMRQESIEGDSLNSLKIRLGHKASRTFGDGLKNGGMIKICIL